MERPHLGPLVHRAITSPVRRDLFSRFRYGEPPAADQLQVTWLGTAGLVLECRGRRLLIDPFVSRPGLRESLLRPLRPDAEVIRKTVPDAVEAIVCSHSHHDHVMDVPEIARLSGARVLGSDSIINLCRAHGLPASQLQQISAGDVVQAGPFRVTFRPSRHGKALLGRVPLVGRIDEGVHPPLTMRQYRNDTTCCVVVEADTGQTPGVTLVHLGSADFLPETIDGLRADVLIPCLMGREHHPGFVRELLLELRPRVVIPFHFDDFFAPLDAPIRELPGADLEGFRREVLSNSVSTRLVILDLLGSFRCSVDDPSLPPRRWE